MTIFQRISQAIAAASQAASAGSPKDAQAALNSLYDSQTELIDGGVNEYRLVTLQTCAQGAQLALLVKDSALARRFTGRLVVELGLQLKQLGQLRNQQLGENHEDMARITDFTAFAYVVAFAPQVRLEGIKNLYGTFLHLDRPVEARVFGSTVEHVRPTLDQASWQAWVQPGEPLRYWGGAALVRWGQHLISNSTEGKDINDALEILLSARELLKGFPDDQLIADQWNLSGRVYAAYGEAHFAEAADAFTQSSRICESLGNTSDAARDQSSLGAIQVRHARFLRVNYRVAEAEALKKEGTANLLTSRAIPGLDKSGPQIETYLQAELNLGTLFSEDKDWERAAVAFEGAWSRVDLSGDQRPYWVTRVAGNYGSALLDEGKLQEAEHWLRIAHQELEKIRSDEPQVVLVVLGSLGRLLCRTQRAEEAYAPLGLAIERLEAFCASTPSERAAGDLFKTYRWIYEWMIDCCVTTGADHPERRILAFEHAERLKWRTLTVLLKYLPLGLVDPVAEPRLIEESRLLGIARTALMSPENAAAGNVAEALRQLDALWSELAVQHPDYVAFRRGQTITFPEVQQLLDDQVSTLVEYYFGEEIAIAFVVTRAQSAPATVRIAASPSELGDKILDLRAKKDLCSQAEFESATRELYELLIRPLEPLVPEGAGVCFVPFGPLHNVSFSGLFDGKRYFIARNGVVIAPTASALRWWKQKDAGRKASCLMVVATNNVYFGAVREADLPWFEHLTNKTIAPLFEPYKTLSGAAATKANFFAAFAAAQADVIHVACHGELSNDVTQQGFDAKLVMGGPPAEEKDLSVIEIMSTLRVGASLVVLCACSSAVAETTTNDEMTGLAQAFLLAGAPSVLATVCPLRQGPGVDIATMFYRCWKGHGRRPSMTRIEALRAAQLASSKRKRWLFWGPSKWHPQQWSAFQLYGNWK